MTVSFEIDRVAPRDVRLYRVKPNGGREWLQTFGTLREARESRYKLEENLIASLPQPERATLESARSNVRGEVADFYRSPTLKNLKRAVAALEEYQRDYDAAEARTWGPRS